MFARFAWCSYFTSGSLPSYIVLSSVQTFYAMFLDCCSSICFSAASFSKAFIMLLYTSQDE
jgi:hypothetical protein